MPCYSFEPRTRKCVRGNDLLSFVKNLSRKYDKELLDTNTKKD